MQFNHPQKNSRLQDHVILLINGLQQQGRVLANMLSRKGADVVIADHRHIPELMFFIQQDVEANGRRCLLLTPDLQTVGADKEKTFLQYIVQTIMGTFGRLDTFVTFPNPELSTNLNGLNIRKNQNGRAPQSPLFDSFGMTKTAIKLILTNNDSAS